MKSFLKNIFGEKPKSLAQLIEDKFEEVVQSSLKNSAKDPILSDPMMQGLILINAITAASESYKEVYSEIHKQLGYTKQEYDKLIDSTCTKIINKYIEY